MKKRTYRFEIRLTKSQADFGFGPGILLRKDVEYDSQPDTQTQEFLEQLRKDSFKILGEVIEFDAKKIAEVEASGTSQCGCGSSSRCPGNHPKLQAGGFAPGATVRDLGNGMVMVEEPHQPVAPPRHCEPRVQSAYQKVLPREVKSDTSKFKLPDFPVKPGRKVTALISVGELVAKVRDLIREEVDKQLTEADCSEQVTSDLSKVEFDRENVQTHEDNDDIPPALFLTNGLAVIPCHAGGDWETAVAFVLYWDGSKIRGYVPQNGNHFNRTTKKAYGNDEAKDEADMVKVYGCNIFDANQQHHDWNKIFDEVQVRISTEGATPVDSNVVSKKPGNGHLVAVSNYQHDSWGSGDYSFTVWETSRKYFEKNNCLDDHSNDEVVPKLLKSIGLSCDCEATWSVDDEHKDQYKTRQQLVDALTALGFETDSAFDDLCQSDEEKEDDDSEEDEDEDELDDPDAISEKWENGDPSDYEKIGNLHGMESQLERVLDDFLPGRNWIVAVSHEKSFGVWKVWVTSREYFAKNHFMDDRCAPPWMLKLMKEIGMTHACDMIFTVSRQNPNLNLYATREELIAALEIKGFSNDAEFQKYGDEHGC